MALSIQQISDRMEIEDLIVEYAHIIDQQEFTRLREIFVEDALIDYSVMGGPRGSREEIIKFLSESLVFFKNTQHMISNYRIRVTGDHATGRIMCFNPMELNLPEQGNPVFFIGLWYEDKYLRTPEGWRISERVEEKSYSFNTPDFINL